MHTGCKLCPSPLKAAKYALPTAPQHLKLGSAARGLQMRPGTTTTAASMSSGSRSDASSTPRSRAHCSHVTTGVHADQQGQFGVAAARAAGALDTHTAPEAYT